MDLCSCDVQITDAPLRLCTHSVRRHIPNMVVVSHSLQGPVEAQSLLVHAPPNHFHSGGREGLLCLQREVQVKHSLVESPETNPSSLSKTEKRRRTKNQFGSFSLLFLINFEKPLNRNITRPNCALDRHTILCLYVTGLQRQVFIRVP